MRTVCGGGVSNRLCIASPACSPAMSNILTCISSLYGQVRKLLCAAEETFLFESVVSFDANNILKKLSTSCTRCTHASTPEPREERAILRVPSAPRLDVGHDVGLNIAVSVCVLVMSVDQGACSFVFRMSELALADGKSDDPR